MPMLFNRANVAKVFARLDVEASRKGFLVLSKLAPVVERQAKINLSGSPHRLGTPTPAVPGMGPGLISGTLRRSITHTVPVRSGVLSWQCKVGTAAGFTPPYGRTPASSYGKYLETGDTRNGAAYPFLAPAVRFGQRIAGPVIYREVFGHWPRMDY